MDLNAIQQLYQALYDSGLAELELQEKDGQRVKLILDGAAKGKEENLIEQKSESPSENLEIISSENKEGESDVKIVEIRSEKVGTYAVYRKNYQEGDRVKFGDILGDVKGAGSTDHIKCPYNGAIKTVETKYGNIVDYGKVLYTVIVDKD